MRDWPENRRAPDPSMNCIEPAFDSPVTADYFSSERRPDRSKSVPSRRQLCHLAIAVADGRVGLPLFNRDLRIGIRGACSAHSYNRWVALVEEPSRNRPYDLTP